MCAINHLLNLGDLKVYKYYSIPLTVYHGHSPVDSTHEWIGVNSKSTKPYLDCQDSLTHTAVTFHTIIMI